ncbi:MAG: hypothetical protein B7C24_01535 [Bacteroidetes bacterium 4572_77]|nr:MAG: hypothetical protein B7C24_01535 [Bacteroidetes bacterium 4572_77]
MSEDKAIIESAMGWVLQDNGRWRSEKSKILLFSSEMNRNPDPLQKYGRDNFTKIILKEVLIEDEQYVILIIFYDGGYFEFPNLRQGFHKQKNAKYFVFDSRKIQEVFPEELRYNEPYAVNLSLFTYDDLIDYDPKELETKISYNVLKTSKTKEKPQFTLMLNLLPVSVDGKKYYRFRFLKLINKRNIYRKYLLDENKDKLFTHSYYELPMKEFVDFFSSIDIIDPDFDIYNPESFSDFYKRGVMRFDRGHYDKALSDFQEALKIDPETRFMMLYAYLGSTQHELGNYPKAIRAFDKAISLEPSELLMRQAWVRVYYNRGVTKYFMENKEDACRDMNTSKTLGLKDQDALIKIKKKCKGKLRNVGL